MGRAAPLRYYDATSRTSAVQVMAIGRFLVNFQSLPADTFLISARYGGHEVLDTGFVVDQNSQTLLELTVGGPASVGAITGRVNNIKGEPSPDACVALIPSASRRSNPAAFRFTTTDQNGTFSLKGILPGEYAIVAMPNIEPNEYRDSLFIKQFEPRATRLKVVSNTQHAVSLILVAR
jgi:hypothetical protein